MEPAYKGLIGLLVVNAILLIVLVSRPKETTELSLNSVEPTLTTESGGNNYTSSENTVQQLLKNGSVEELNDFLADYPNDSAAPAIKKRIAELTGSRVSSSHSSSSSRSTTSSSNSSTTARSAKPTNPNPEPERRRTLTNGSQPYSAWYGYNQKYNSDKPQSTIQVTSSVSQDVIVVVKYNNKDGRVAGHLYIQAGKTGKIYVSPGYRYQVFFYYGDDWDPDKIMKGTVRGGFTRNEYADEDPNSQYFALEETYDGITWDGGVEYNLNRVRNGNFSTKRCSTNDVF